MKASELISALQALVSAHGDMRVSYNDNELGFMPVSFVEAPMAGTDEGFISLSECSVLDQFTPAAFQEDLRRAMGPCPIDHWSWDADKVMQHHPLVLKRAGITDVNAWVATERAKKAKP